jgi:hypothetical protein
MMVQSWVFLKAALKVLCSGGRRERLKAVARGWRMVHGWVQR